MRLRFLPCAQANHSHNKRLPLIRKRQALFCMFAYNLSIHADTADAVTPICISLETDGVPSPF